MGKRIVVLGSSFAGMTTAIELKRRLGAEHEVVVLSRGEAFVFLPSLVWLPFGLRDKDDLSFPLAPVYEKRGVVFKQTAVMSLLLHDRRVVTADGPERYDYLVIATGGKPHYAAIPGLGPRGGFTSSIFSLADAELARVAVERFLANPGPVVVGAVQGASTYSAACEFLLNLAYQVRRRGLTEKVPLTYVTSEPYVGHLGFGGFGASAKALGTLFEKNGIAVEANAAFRQITHDAVHLEDGRRVPFSFAMIAPAIRGVDAVASCHEIVDQAGFVRVDDAYRTEAHPEVYAAGVAVAVHPPEPTPVPCGVPKTGYLSEEMARVVAHNIAAAIHGDPLVRLPVAAMRAKLILDGGNTGVVMSADHHLEPRDHAWLVPGPEAHWAKLAYEKHFLGTRSRGLV